MESLHLIFGTHLVAVVLAGFTKFSGFTSWHLGSALFGLVTGERFLGTASLSLLKRLIHWLVSRNAIHLQRVGFLVAEGIHSRY